MYGWVNSDHPPIDNERVCTLFKHTLLEVLAFPKIDEGLDKRETGNDILTQRLKLRAWFSLQRHALHFMSLPRHTARRGDGDRRTHPCDAQRYTPLGLRIGFYEVTQALDLCEVKPATLVRATGELSWCSRAAPGDARKRSEYCTNDGSPTVYVQF
jgi:hypothetical protein